MPSAPSFVGLRCAWLARAQLSGLRFDLRNVSGLRPARPSALPSSASCGRSRGDRSGRVPPCSTAFGLRGLRPCNKLRPSACAAFGLAKTAPGLRPSATAPTLPSQKGPLRGSDLIALARLRPSACAAFGLALAPSTPTRATRTGTAAPSPWSNLWRQSFGLRPARPSALRFLIANESGIRPQAARPLGAQARHNPASGLVFFF